MNQSSKFIAAGTAPIKKVGRFLLYRELGRGAIGTVYFGHDPVIDRDVAIKIFHNLPTAQDKKQRDQIFMNEARAAGRLSHPNIITIFDAATEGNISFIAMEYLQGQDLRQFLADDKPLPYLLAAQMMQKIAEGLEYAHNEGVIHRDIKPANIFIMENMQTKLVDFGIARAVKRETTTNNETHATLFNNNILGTPNYMSPEQAQAKAVDKLTDVYSLGAVMYEVLLRQKPFQTRDMDTLLHMIINKPVKPPHETNPAIPLTLSRIVMKAMAKLPEKRYQSASEMAMELRRYVLMEKRDQQKQQKVNSGVKSKEDSYGRLFWISCVAISIAALVALSFWFKH
ncbi:serine/threonine protein kinase [Oxalobacteraceae bacterium GrIS 2.11]